jgi:hypothetical protein
VRAWLKTLSLAFEADLRSLALARIGLGLVLLGDLSIRSLALRAHYTDFGVLPRENIGLSLNKWRICLHLVTGSTPGEAVLFLLAALSALALLLGYRTRLATVVCWVLTFSLQNRNPMVLTGGDTVLRCLLFWGCFMPLGARWSLDRRLRSPTGSEDGKLAAKTVVGAGVAAWMFQVFLVHFFAGALKTGAEWRSDFTALYYALQIDQLQLPMGALLLKLPLSVLKAMTASIMVAEMVFPFLLFPVLFGLERWRHGIRLAVVLALMSFHLGLIFTLRLGIFPWVNLVSLAVFLPPLVWDRLPRFERLFQDLTEGLAGRLRGGWLERWAGSPAAALRLPWWQTVTVVAFMVLVLTWNLDTLPRSPVSVPRKLQPVVYALRLDQRWNLFAPRPYTSDGWWVIPGKLRNGEWVDLYRHGRPIGYEKPADVSAEYPTYRWRKYLRNLYRGHNKTHRTLYETWVCREWNRRHPPEEQAVELRLIYMEEQTPPPGTPTQVAPKALGTLQCPEDTLGPASVRDGK